MVLDGDACHTWFLVWVQFARSYRLQLWLAIAGLTRGRLAVATRRAVARATL